MQDNNIINLFNSSKIKIWTLFQLLISFFIFTASLFYKIYTTLIWLIDSYKNYTYVKLAFLAVRHTDLSRFWSPSKFSFSFITNSLFNPGACKKMISHSFKSLLCSFNI